MKHELKRYVDLSAQIRDLSAPQLSEIQNAEDYRKVLLQSFQQIAELSKETKKILNEHFYPILNENHPLTDQEIQDMKDFCFSMMDATNMENLDMTIIYLFAQRLLRYGKEFNDFRITFDANDLNVMASYTMMTITERLAPEFPILYAYRDTGIEAAEEIISYLDHDAFSSLDERDKHTVLINARYISALFDWSDKDDPAQYTNHDLLMMKDALALANDPFYVRECPNYNWKYHTFRTLQYITTFTYYNNKRLFNKAQLKEIYEYTGKLLAHIHFQYPEIEEECRKETQHLYLLRNEYFVGMISLEEYKEGLRYLFQKRRMENYEAWNLYTNFMVPYEYILVLEGNEITEVDKEFLRCFYHDIVIYINLMPKVGVFSFSITFLCEIVRHYIEIEDAPGFGDFCLSLMAVLHPPTYVHSLSVSNLISFLAKELMNKKPELFIGLLDTKNVDEVLLHKEEIIDYTRKAGLYHDVGKIFIIEVIMTYGRKLFPLEYEMINYHPIIGSNLLAMHKDTAPYAEAALAHHKWYDGTDGYPENFPMKYAKQPILLAILHVADCLDAATDKIGRNYKKGLSFDEFIEELKEGYGTRYAPYIVDLFLDPTIKEKLEEYVEEIRAKNYRETFELLKEYREY